MSLQILTRYGLSKASTGGGPVVLASDSFTDADSTGIAAHTMNAGGGWTQGKTSPGIVGTPASDIQGNALRIKPNNMLVITPAAADGTITADWTLDGTTGHRVGVVFRYADVDNYWYFRCREPNGDVALVELSGGISTVRASAAQAFSLSTTYALKVIASGASIRAYVEGAEVLSFTSAVHQSNTDVGLVRFTSRDEGRFDNFLATTP